MFGTTCAAILLRSPEGDRICCSHANHTLIWELDLTQSCFHCISCCSAVPIGLRLALLSADSTVLPLAFRHALFQPVNTCSIVSLIRNNCFLMFPVLQNSPWALFFSKLQAVVALLP